MSKIGRKIIKIPEGLKVEVTQGQVKVAGPKASLGLKLHPAVEVLVTDGALQVKRRQETKVARAVHGTTRALIANMMVGLTKGFEVKLIIEGVGFKAAVQGDQLNLTLGYTHPVQLKIPTGVAIAIDKGLITITGADKHLVGQFAATVRQQRIPDAYKGKGIRYEDEQLKLKPGKKAATATAAA